MPGPLKKEKLTTGAGSDLRQMEIQLNHLVRDLMRTQRALSTDMVWSWQSATANSTQALGRGSTDTAVATGAFMAGFKGLVESKAAVTTGTALSAATVPADTWALWAFDCVTGGTVSAAGAAANGTTGYTTEALAIAAIPARITAKARLGYITVKTKAANTFVAGTDGLAGGASGNVASTTNYYPYDGAFTPTGQSYGPNNVVTAADNAIPANLSAWSAGRNGVIIGTVMAIGSTDTRFATTAFVYNANGITNINKAAVTAGTAFGALGTIPASKWGIIVGLIDTLGAITYLSGPANYTTGYNNEAAAIADLNKIFPTATDAGGLCKFGYVTIKASASTFVVQTDALAGGATGNPASGTNYYPTASAPFLTTNQGEVASLIAQQTGAVVLDANY